MVSDIHKASLLPGLLPGPHRALPQRLPSTPIPAFFAKLNKDTSLLQTEQFFKKVELFLPMFSKGKNETLL